MGSLKDCKFKKKMKFTKFRIPIKQKEGKNDKMASFPVEYLFSIEKRITIQIFFFPIESNGIINILYQRLTNRV